MRRRIFSAVLEGRVAYGTALEAQRRLARARIEGAWEEDLLLLLEHEPVLTVGRGAGQEHVVAPPGRLASVGIETVEVERGGDVTYHGPGQLVGYPILDLRDHRRDLHWYVRTLEEALIRTASEYGIPAGRVEGYTGVWTGERDGAPLRDGLDARTAAPLVAAGAVRKLASIGVHVSRWITWHGFALNVTREPLEAFDLIVPCGIAGVRMTSLEAEGRPAGDGPLGSELRGAVERGFAAALETPVERARADLLGRLRELAPGLRFGPAPAARAAEAEPGAVPESRPFGAPGQGRSRGADAAATAAGEDR